MTTVLPTKPVPAVKADDYYLLAPNADPIRIPQGLYEAIRKFTAAKSYFAQIVVTVKAGGIAGVEATEKTVYK